MTGHADDTFCFVHAADLHLDTPFVGVHAGAPEVAAALREASLDAFDSIVSLALGRDAAFCCIAGDIYDGARRGVRAQLRFRDGLARLAAAGIATFVVHRNHDPVTTGWAAVSFPDEVTIFGHDAVGVVPVVRGGVQIATVQGISYATHATTENLALRFARPEGPGVHVGLLHCNVSGAGGGHEDYSPCTLDDLRRARLDYWALGHVHQQRVLAEGRGPGDPWVAYPGTSQARSARPGERGPKGALVVQVRAGVVTGVEPVACDRVRFHALECPLDDVEALDELEERLESLAAEALAAGDGRSVVVDATLVGRGPLHRDLARPGSLEDLLEHLRSGTSRRAPFCWWDRVVDRSGAPVELADVRARRDFSSDLLAVADVLAVQPDAAASAARGLVESVPRALRAQVEAIVRDPGRFPELVEAAARLALDELSGGEP
ncbi:MAG: DNA repair exonuclease [Actinomycetota bacterium]|nr:DNA repair exonuclease [Actinomycetota bacterium]